MWNKRIPYMIRDSRLLCYSNLVTEKEWKHAIKILKNYNLLYTNYSKLI